MSINDQIEVAFRLVIFTNATGGIVVTDPWYDREFWNDELIISTRFHQMEDIELVAITLFELGYIDHVDSARIVANEIDCRRLNVASNEPLYVRIMTDWSVEYSK